jgi:hypothetical protein
MNKGARHIARGARIFVIAPGAAEVFAFVDNLEVGDTFVLEVDRGADAAETRADDEYVENCVFHKSSAAMPFY